MLTVIGLIILLVGVYVFIYFPTSQIRNFLIIVLLAMIGYALVATVAEMPAFGVAGNPVNNIVCQHYITSAVEETGALNIVASIIADYRAFDTLGEATVLFVAIAAVISNLKAH